LTISGECQGTKKDSYEVEVEITVTEEGKEWTGNCQCDNSANKGNICSHQAALLLTWVDDKLMNDGTRKISERIRIKKAPKSFQISKENKALISKKKKDLDSYSVATLKSMLRHNELIQSGNKDELISRISESIVLGSIPKCTTCGGGRPKYQSGFWFCEGYKDDVDWRDCHWIDLEVDRKEWLDYEKESS